MPRPKNDLAALGGQVPLTKQALPTARSPVTLTRTTSFDLSVVGAGPAGLQAALRAASKGLRAVLIERQNQIGFPVRTSGGSYIADLTELGIPSRFLHPLTGVVFASWNRQVQVTYPAPTACVLDVRGAYQHLAIEAARLGCQIWIGSTVRAPRIVNGRVSGVELEPGGMAERADAQFTVDASGGVGITLRAAGLSGNEPGRFGIGLEYEAFVENPDSSRAYLLLSSRFAPGGYGWVFPCAEDRVRIGIGVLRPESPGSPLKLLERLLRCGHPLVSGLGRIEPIELHGGSIPVEPPPSRATAPGLLVAGDAARQSNPVVGEGIRQAMRFGRLAADTVAGIILDGEGEEEALQRYETAVVRHLTSMKSALELNRAMATYDEAHWDDLVRVLEVLSPEEVLRVLRGELSAGFLLKLALRHPRIVTGRAARKVRVFARK